MNRVVLTLLCTALSGCVSVAADIDPKDLGLAHRPIEFDADAAVATGTGLFGMGLACTVFVFALMLIVNFAPVLIAAVRKHPNTLPIFLVVLFFGWTFIGWVVALIWAFTNPHQSTTVVVKQYNDRPKRRHRDDDDD